MSVLVSAAVWAGYPGDGSDLLALLALADWADDEGRCFPSMQSIADKIRLSKSQAQRAVHRLINSGFVQVVGNEFGGRPGATRIYRIVLSALTGRTDATGSTHATGRTDAAYGSHPCGETGSAHATQTISEPSLNRISTSDEVLVASKPATPVCPHQEILDLYAEHLPTLPQPRIWEGQRQRDLGARWKWVLTAKRRDGSRYAETREQALGFFARYFDYIAKECPFLLGEGSDWSADLGWLVKSANFAKVLAGNYQRKEAA